MNEGDEVCGDENSTETIITLSSVSNVPDGLKKCDLPSCPLQVSAAVVGTMNSNMLIADYFTISHGYLGSTSLTIDCSGFQVGNGISIGDLCDG